MVAGVARSQTAAAGGQESGLARHGTPRRDGRCGAGGQPCLPNRSVVPGGDDPGPEGRTPGHSKDEPVSEQSCRLVVSAGRPRRGRSFQQPSWAPRCGRSRGSRALVVYPKGSITKRPEGSLMPLKDRVLFASRWRRDVSSIDSCCTVGRADDRASLRTEGGVGPSSSDHATGRGPGAIRVEDLRELPTTTAVGAGYSRGLVQSYSVTTRVADDHAR